jgi:aryl-alcohol dehydrogenase-like predicted oxidoreductase
MFTRRLGRSDLQVSALGLGCWAMGGPWTIDNETAGWGVVDDAESIRAIHYALNHGVNFFDTAANYGAGHSERVLGQALEGRRGDVIIATKFGYVVDEAKRTATTTEDVLPRIRSECEDSLRRLRTDTIDLYQFHKADYPPEKAAEVRDLLESLVTEGKIRWYGWSTNQPAGARVFAQGSHCNAIQHYMNPVRHFEDLPQLLEVIREFDLASVLKSPLIMGIITGKFTTDTKFPADDVRHTWNLAEGKSPQNLQRIETMRAFFKESGDPRSLAQIALAWAWSYSERAIPIPGFRTLAQVRENIQAADYGPLTADQLAKVEQIFERNPVNS